MSDQHERRRAAFATFARLAAEYGIYLTVNDGVWCGWCGEPPSPFNPPGARAVPFETLMEELAHIYLPAQPPAPGAP